MEKNNYTTAATDLGMIQTLAFPANIGDGAEGTSNYMVIYINELDTSKWATHKKRPLSKEQAESDAPAIQRSNTSFTSVLDKAKTNLDEKVESVTGSDVIDAVYPSYKRTSFIIALPLPEQLANTYSSNWNQAEMTSMGAELLEMATSPGSMSSKVLERLKVGAASNAAKIALSSSASTALTKSVRNPRRELIFDGNLPRGFNFTWTLFPRSETESKALWDITQMLKLQQLPELSLGEGSNSGFWVNFPATFEFEFYTNNKRNDWLFKSSTCAMTSLDLNYTPTGTATFFDSSNVGDLPSGNAPNGISLSINFMEVELLFKNRIDINNNFRFNTDQIGSLAGVL